MRRVDAPVHLARITSSQASSNTHKSSQPPRLVGRRRRPGSTYPDPRGRLRGRGIFYESEDQLPGLAAPLRTTSTVEVAIFACGV